MSKEVNNQLVFQIGENEYEGKQHIETTLFLEICRITNIAAELLYAYKTDKEFQKQVDFSLDSVKPADIGAMFLSVRLQDIVCKYLAEWLEPHELGEGGQG